MIIQNTKKWEVGRAEYHRSIRTELVESALDCLIGRRGRGRGTYMIVGKNWVSFVILFDQFLPLRVTEM
jgi:hypothetical protein